MLRNGQEERVRLIGISAPELGQPLAEDASTYLATQLAGREVRLERDVTERDRFGRLLRHVFVVEPRGTLLLVNEAMVRVGLATVSTFPPDVAYVERYGAAQAEARAEGVGAWTPSASAGVRITTVFFDGAEPQVEGDEYVEFRNESNEVIDLTGWVLVSVRGNQTYSFPAGSLVQPGQACRVYTDEIHPEWCGFNFAYHDSAIWYNGGEAAELRDQSGAIVARWEY